MEEITTPSQASGAKAKSTTTDGLQPGHDVFCTPENKAIYESNTYTELDPTKHEIRLVRLLPENGDKDGMIQCELLPPVLLETVKYSYTAPSYCAGSARKTKPILLNGKIFSVFSNLDHTLREIRNFWTSRYSKMECLLWVDQISINQQNINERSHQVRFMRQIYENAQKVLVCLSTKEVDSRCVDWARELIHDLPPDWIKEPAWRSVQERLKVRLNDTNFVNSWNSFYDMIGSPWFSRAWVYQEYIVAFNALFLYAGSVIHVNDLLSFCRLVRDISGSDDSHKALNMIYSSIDEEERRCIEGRSNHLNSLSRLRRNIIKETYQKIALNTLSMIDTRQEWHELKRCCQNVIDLKRLLNHARYCATSDPRDKVFAFLGLADSGYKILPDYTQSISHILVRTTMRMIIFEGSLRVLSHAIISEDRLGLTLPSWVVNWTSHGLAKISRYQDAGVLNPNEVTSLTKIAASASFTFTVPDDLCYTLRVKGIFAERIDRDYLMEHGSVEINLVRKQFTCFSQRVFEKNDEIWFIQGSGVPLIFRPWLHSDYRLIAAVKIPRRSVGIPPDSCTLEDWESLLRSLTWARGEWDTISIV